MRVRRFWRVRRIRRLRAWVLCRQARQMPAGVCRWCPAAPGSSGRGPACCALAVPGGVVGSEWVTAGSNAWRGRWALLGTWRFGWPVGELSLALSGALGVIGICRAGCGLCWLVAPCDWRGGLVPDLGPGLLGAAASGGRELHRRVARAWPRKLPPRGVRRGRRRSGRQARHAVWRAGFAGRCSQGGVGAAGILASALAGWRWGVRGCSWSWDDVP